MREIGFVTETALIIMLKYALAEQLKNGSFCQTDFMQPSAVNFAGVTFFSGWHFFRMPFFQGDISVVLLPARVLLALRFPQRLVFNQSAHLFHIQIRLIEQVSRRSKFFLYICRDGSAWDINSNDPKPFLSLGRTDLPPLSAFVHQLLETFA